MAPVLAVQTFTIRRDLKNPAAIDGAFARLSELGVSAVELAYIDWQPTIVQAVKDACDRHAITVASSQIKLTLLDKQRDDMLRHHELLACTNTAVSVMPLAVILGSRDRLLRFAGSLDALGSWYRERGVQLCFHHHDFELRPYGEQTGLEQLVAYTDPENVALELDTYWLARGGLCPHEVIAQLAGRVRVVHLRDFGLRRGLPGPRPYDTALGEGNLDINAIVAACRQAEVETLAIEQAAASPWECLARSVAFLREQGHTDFFSSGSV